MRANNAGRKALAPSQLYQSVHLFRIREATGWNRQLFAHGKGSPMATAAPSIFVALPGSSSELGDGQSKLQAHSGAVPTAFTPDDMCGVPSTTASKTSCRPVELRG